MNQDDLQISPHALLQGVAHASQPGAMQIDQDAAQALHWLGHAMNEALTTVQGWIAIAWLNLVQAANASRPLLDAMRLWLQHMTPKTAQGIGTAARAWIGHPAVQHVLVASAALVVLALLLRATRRTAVATGAAAAQGRGVGSWHRSAGLVGTGAAIGAGSAFAADAALHAFDAMEDSSSMHGLGADMGCAINPATGMPMISGDCAGVDVMGNPYGFDMHDTFSTDHAFHSDTDSLGSSHDSFGSSFDSFDSWSSGSSWD